MDESAKNAAFEDETGFDCGRLVRRVCGNKVLLAVCVGLFLLAGLAYVAVVPRLYQATTIIEVHEPGADTADRGREEVGEMRLKTVEQSLRRISVYRRVVARDDFCGVFFSGEPDEAAFQQEAERLAGRTRVRWQRGTGLIFVTVVDGNPELAEQQAGALVDEFIREQVERGREGRGLRLGLLSQALGSLQKRMREHQEVLAAIRGLEGAGKSNHGLEIQENGGAGLTRGKTGGASGLAQFEGLIKKGGEFWKGLDLNQLSGLAEEKRMDVISKYAQGRAEVLGMEIDTEKKLFASHMGEIKELEFLVEIEEPGIRVVEPAFVLPGTVGPGRGLILIVSIFLGLAVGLVLVWCKSVCWVNGCHGEK